jgi:glycosyltransferase involved in cell wall biosynthesis
MEMREKQSIDLSIVMPCLNEADAVGFCVREAWTFIEKYHISGEVLVVDNGSEDNSAAAAEKAGAKVIWQPQRGYGSAIRAGMENSSGSVIIIGDCDATYDFLHLEEMYRMLSAGEWDMVIGNRFAGGIEPGSMPWTHKWGVRFLSWIGRATLHTDIYDFHCGLRGLTRSAAECLEFHTVGMEFATEMIVQAVKNGLRIQQCPAGLRKCKYPRKSKLRTIRDGVRHLTYMIRMYLSGGK